MIARNGVRRAAVETGRPLSFEPRRSWLSEQLRLRHLDRVMLGASIGLIALGIFALATATSPELPEQPHYFAFRQGAYAALGLALMLAVARIEYSRLLDLRVGIYSAMVASILAVLLFGTAVRGSNRWIELPLLRLQPSELAKTLLVISLAAFAFERVRRHGPWRLRRTLLVLGLGLAPAALVFLQPDLGSGVVLVIGALAVLFLAAVPWQHFAVIAAAGAALLAGAFALGPTLGVEALRGYQQERLTAFLHPSEDPGDASYQVNQAVISVGSGEATGRGDEATQSELEFLPERQTDFAFAAIAERFGFLGSLLVLCLYAVLIWRGFRVMARSGSLFGIMIAGGIVAMLLFQLVVNVGMNLGMMPVAGITMPLISYGGSSVLGTFIAIGVLQSIHVHTRLARRGRRAPLVALPGGRQTPRVRRARFRGFGQGVASPRGGVRGSAS